MKSDEIIREIEYREKKIAQISKEVDKLKNEKKELYEIILKAISFVPYDLAEAIIYLVHTKEGKQYIPEEGTYFHDSKEYRYLILCRENHSNNPNIYLNQPDNINIFFDRYTVSPTLSLNHNSLTFEHLIEKYNIDKKQWIGSINFSEFESHPYIKDFITYLAEWQIENNGKLLSKKDMHLAVNAFVSTYDIICSKRKDAKTLSKKK